MSESKTSMKLRDAVVSTLPNQAHREESLAVSAELAGYAPDLVARGLKLGQQRAKAKGFRGQNGQVFAQAFAKGYCDARPAAFEQGRRTERERIRSVLGESSPGHEALIESLAYDGQSTAGDAALAVLAAERAKRFVVVK